MKKLLIIHCTFAIGIILFEIAVLPSNAPAAEPQRVAMIPFKVNAEKDLSYLRDGIFDMLSSRLSDPGKVQVLSRAEVEKAMAEETGSLDETAARRIGAKLDADHVLYGSLTMFGSSLSLDAKMLAVADAQPPVTLYSQSPDMGDVIPEIDRFAAEINTKVFGRQALAAAPAAVPAAPRTESQPDSRAHPEKLLQGGAVEGGGPVKGSPFIKRKDQLLQSAGYWKSPNLNFFMAGIAVGDVDGDGLNETVILSPDEINIHRFQDDSFIQVKRLEKLGDHFHIAVDVADINANGRAEIFVTALNRFKNAVTSFVVEYNGKDYAVIAKDQPWYFRVTDTPVRGKILLGQQNRLGTPYGGEIFEMQWDGGVYAPQSGIKSPSGINVLGVALADVLNDGSETLLAFNSGNNIEIFTPGGDRLWKGNDKFGGSVIFYSGPKTDQGQIENPLYLPMRILVRNRTEDSAKNEVIAVKNREVMGMRWNRREFLDATIEALTWAAGSLDTEWSTRKMTRFISDIQIADFDNDGRDELMAGLIIKNGEVILTSAKSALIAYDLEAAPEGANVDTSAQ
ncbi:MAG: VCBS repeat-containing protein [Desulfobacterales bacterium]